MKPGTDILWLSEKDVASLLTMDDACWQMEAVFRLHGEGKVQMPTKMYLTFDPFGGDLRAMPAYVKGDMLAAGVKIVNSNPKNPQLGLPAVSGIMVYNDPKTGLPLGVFAAGTLTAMRTGAAGAVAAMALARADSKTVGLVGCGRQAVTQLHGILSLYPLMGTVLVSGKDWNEASAFCRTYKKPSISKAVLVPCHSIEEACQADIVVTTTPARAVVVKKKYIRPGTHINAIGADAAGKQELEISLLKSARVVVDDWNQASHAGEINVAVSKGILTRKKIAGELGEVLVEKKRGRTNPNDITIFDSTGLAIQDVAVAKGLYEKALKLKKGRILKFNG